MQKILVCGSVNGSISKAYNRIAKLQQKAGNFDLLICCGEFFNASAKDEWQQYQTGEQKIPIQTYILGPSSEETAEFYGKSGIYKMSGGLTVVYLSGTQAGGESSYCEDEVRLLVAKLQKNVQDTGFGCDILITHDWPSGVSRFANAPTGDSSATEGDSRLVSVLAACAKPQYHFAGARDVHYERAPYRNHRQFEHVAPREKVVTRFISLARFAEPQASKTFYAFRISPRSANAEEADRSADISASTESPYFDIVDQLLNQWKLRAAPKAGAAGRTNERDNAGGRQFFFDEAAMRRMGNPQKRRRDGEGPEGQWKQRRGGAHSGATSSECWFCLGAPNVSKHLVVHVGEHTYLALPKGPLVDSHVLIIPIVHIASIVSAPDDTVREIERYKTALRIMFTADDCVPVFYERNYRSQHLQIQAVPVRRSLSASLKPAILEFGRSFAQRTRRAADQEQHGSEFFVEIPSNTELKQAFSLNEAYFYVELPSGEKLIHRVDTRNQTPFPVQFGREMLACPALLNTPDRIDWHACAQSVDEETAAAQRFREKFAPFDFIDADAV